MSVTLNLNISKPENTVRSFRDLSIRDSRNLVAFSKQVFANMNNNPAINNDKAVAQMIGRIDATIQNRSIWRKFLDLITFQFIKIIILKNELPLLIQNINQISGNIIGNPLNNDPDDPTDDYDATVENNNWQDDPEFKLDLMIRAFDHFQADRAKNEAANMHNANWKKTADEVDRFFQDRIGRLTRDENVAVPIYYHASRLGTDLIAGSSLLKQSAYGAQGPGVYFSTSDESHGGYGPCTFAMDPAQIEKCQTTYSNGMAHYNTGEEASLWMCAKQDIQLIARRLAYVIIPDDGDQTLNDKIKKFWVDGNFFVELITRPAADWIRKSIKAVHIHSVPQHWKGHGAGYRSPTYVNHIVAD